MKLCTILGGKWKAKTGLGPVVSSRGLNLQLNEIKSCARFLQWKNLSFNNYPSLRNEVGMYYSGSVCDIARRQKQSY